MRPVLVVGSFDRIQACEIRLLQAASRWGPVRVLLWSDAAAAEIQGREPTCPEAERQYVLNAIRYVDKVTISDFVDAGSLLPTGFAAPGGMWVVRAEDENGQHAAWCRDRAVDYRVISDDVLRTIPQGSAAPDQLEAEPPGERPKVLVTGCYDWFHSGHIRFFEEVSQLGDLYVVVGHDENIKLLKGAGHPMFPAIERRYIVDSISYVRQALISSGSGWLDAEPEIQRIKPDIYAVNEDGDRPEKRDYCEKHGITYQVLRRVPRAGLPRRQSTDLRGY